METMLMNKTEVLKIKNTIIETKTISEMSNNTLVSRSKDQLI